jgi:hypothetical protein
VNIPERLESSRAAITAFLSGEIDSDTQRVMFEDDILLFAVAHVDEADPDWILSQLSDQAWPAELRVQILWLMRSHYSQGHAILVREAPGLLRNMPEPRD